MDESVIRAYEARLRAEFDSIAAGGDLGAEDRATVALDQQAMGRLSRADALQRQAMAAAQVRRRDARRRQVVAALSRIAEGEFGYCVECGEEIAPARLDFDPAVSTCIACARG